MLPTNTTVWADIGASSFQLMTQFALRARILNGCSATGAKTILLFCIKVRGIPPFQLIYFRVAILKVHSQDHWSVPLAFAHGPRGPFSNCLSGRGWIFFIFFNQKHHFTTNWMNSSYENLAAFC